jgi:hypothetical protein
VSDTWLVLNEVVYLSEAFTLPVRHKETPSYCPTLTIYVYTFIAFDDITSRFLTGSWALTLNRGLTEALLLRFSDLGTPNRHPNKTGISCL